MPTPLASVSQLAPVRAQFEALGYSTLEAVLETARVVPADILDRYLGRHLAQLLAPLPPLPPSKRSEYPVGVKLADIRRPTRAHDFVRFVGKLPEIVESLDRQHVRDQSRRSTCAAFAACAVLEAAAIRGDDRSAPGLQYSPQFLYWDCKENDGDPERGTYLAVAFECLRRDGVCFEADWCYRKDLPATGHPEGEGPPPPEATSAAGSHRIAQYLDIPPNSVAGIQAQLAQGACVAVTFPIFASWFNNDDVSRSGELIMPIPGEEATRAHCVCLVGYISDASRPGGGDFVFRNSWGAGWGKESPDQAGYGRLPFQFLIDNGTEAYSVEI